MNNACIRRPGCRSLSETRMTGCRAMVARWPDCLALARCRLGEAPRGAGPMTVISVVPDQQAHTLTLTAQYAAPVEDVWQPAVELEVGFVGLDGRQVRMGLAEGVPVRFEAVAPVRAFPSFKRQRYFPGLWWSATTRRQVGYESWLERDHLMPLDHDPAVVGIASQPFWLFWQHDGKLRSHAPDYFARRADGSAEVVDCRPLTRITADPYLAANETANNAGPRPAGLSPRPRPPTRNSHDHPDRTTPGHPDPVGLPQVNAMSQCHLSPDGTWPVGCMGASSASGWRDRSAPSSGRLSNRAKTAGNRSSNGGSW